MKNKMKNIMQVLKYIYNFKFSNYFCGQFIFFYCLSMYIDEDKYLYVI